MVFKPASETHNNNHIISSRNVQSFDQVVAVPNLQALAGQIALNQPDIIMIDECQFFEIGANNDAGVFVLMIKELLTENKHIAISGLLEDCYGGQFKILNTLYPLAS